MIEKALNTIGGAQAEAYYFQLYPLNLSIIGKESVVPAPGTTYRFSIIKGQQKFDENKLPVEANFKNVGEKVVMLIPKCPLNFYLPNFSKSRKIEFTFTLNQTEKE